MTADQILYRAAADGTRRRVLGMTHLNKFTPVQTGGYLLLELTVPPGCGSPLHMHEEDAECFHMLEGELAFTDGMAERVARSGESCFLPPRLTHGFVNRGATTARALVVLTPGVSAQGFFDDLDQLADAPGMPDPVRVATLAAQHRISCG